MNIQYVPVKMLLLFGLCFIHAGCATLGSNEEAAIAAKFDEHLQLAMETGHNSQPLDCFIQIQGGPDAQKLDELEEAGLELVSITDSILAVRGFAEDIKRAAYFDYVESIALRQMDNPE